MLFPTNANQVQAFAGALYGVQVGSVTMAQVTSDITSGGGLNAVLNRYYSASFGSMTTTAVATSFATNLGLTGAALTEGVAYTTARLNAVTADARGAVISDILNLFSTLTADATFGTAATAWTTKVTVAAAYTGTANVAIGTVVATSNVFTLTTGSDNFTGTSGNDTFNGLIGTGATLSAGDVINGGAGTDTLNITYANDGGAVADGFAGALISGIELVNVRNTNATNANGVTIAASGLQGVSASGAGDVTVTALANNVAFTANGTSGGAFSLTNVAAATNTAVNLVGATTNAITLAGAGLTTATIKTSGAASTTGTVTSAVAGLKTWNIDAGSNLTTVIDTAGTSGTLNVSGAAASVNVGTLDTDFTTVNASGLTAGGLTATMSATATTKITGGAGADKITTGATLTTGTVDAGAGADTLTVAASAHLNTAALGAKYTNFETLGVLNGAAVNLDHIAGITAVEMTDGDSDDTALNNLSAAQAAAITIKEGNGAAIIGVKGATTVGQIDTVKMTFNNGNTTLNEAFAGVSTFTLAGVENLEVTAVDKAAIVQSAAASGALTSVKLFGAGDISFTTGNMATSNFVLDASGATGITTLDASGFATNGIAITGGSGVDTITGSGQDDIINAGAGNDIINGGAGKDTINAGAGNDTITVNNANQQDVITVGAGNDIVKFSAADFVDMLKTSAGTAGAVHITDFVAGTDKIGIVDTGGANTSIVLAAAQTIATAADLTAVYAGITAIAASADGGSLSAAVITVSAGAAAGTYLYVNDATPAVAAADDMLINLTGISGTLTAADFVFA